MFFLFYLLFFRPWQILTVIIPAKIPAADKDPTTNNGKNAEPEVSQFELPSASIEGSSSAIISISDSSVSDDSEEGSSKPELDSSKEEDEISASEEEDCGGGVQVCAGIAGRATQGTDGAALEEGSGTEDAGTDSAAEEGSGGEMGISGRQWGRQPESTSNASKRITRHL